MLNTNKHFKTQKNLKQKNKKNGTANLAKNKNVGLISVVNIRSYTISVK
jgi:hypothetical protein